LAAARWGFIPRTIASANPASSVRNGGSRNAFKRSGCSSKRQPWAQPEGPLKSRRNYNYCQRVTHLCPLSTGIFVQVSGFNLPAVCTGCFRDFGSASRFPRRGFRGDAMTIDQLVQQHAFEPEAVREMTDAYKRALHTLHVGPRYAGLAEVLASKIIEAAQRGITGADMLCATALREIGHAKKNPSKTRSASPRTLRRIPC
jgi:hypothetical protein